MYDVLIVGAGPAGAAAARVLAQQGLRVLLIERFPLPRNKSCSGVLIQKTLNWLEREIGLPVPQSALCTPYDNRGMVFTDDQGCTTLFEQPGLNIWRAPFDGWLTDLAVRAGAQVHAGCGVTNLEEADNTVTATLRDGKTITARYAILCEGALGTLKRRLTGTPTPHVITFQTFNQGKIDLDPHYFYAYLQPTLSQYDAWFNVKDDQLVLGVSVRDQSRIPAFYAAFLQYMQAHHGLVIEKELRSEKWLMPAISPGCPVTYGAGRVLFAGVTAGFLNPMGEGISSALESGRCAAQAIAYHFDDADAVYASYRDAAAPLQTYMLRQWQFVGNRAGTFAQMR